MDTFQVANHFEQHGTDAGKGALTCKVCGALVPAGMPMLQRHVQWHADHE